MTAAIQTAVILIIIFTVVAYAAGLFLLYYHNIPVLSILTESLLLAACEVCQSVAGEAVDGPVAQGRCAKLEVEVYAGFVPVKTHPLESAALTLHGDLCKLAQQAFAVALTAVFGQHEQVLKIQSRSAQECRKVVEEQGKAHFFSLVVECEYDLGFFALEYPFAQGFFVCDNVVGHFFIVGKSADKGQDSSAVLLGCYFVVYIFHRLHLRFFIVYHKRRKMANMQKTLAKSSVL